MAEQEMGLATGYHGTVAETTKFKEPIDNGAIRQGMCGPTKMQRSFTPALERLCGIHGRQDFSDLQPPRREWSPSLASRV
jgi:hypothetical protein